MFIPRVKSEKLYGTKSKIKMPVKVFFADAQAKRLGAVIPEFSPYLKFKEVNSAADADFVFELRAGISDKEEYYKLVSKEGKLSVHAVDMRGLINAAATLSQMFSYVGEELYLSDLEIEDYPDKPFRSFMIDTGRKYIPMDEFRAQILMSAKSKMNKFHWHISDGQGYPIEFDSYPMLKSPDKAGRKYTKDEVRELVKYASLFEVDIIPEIDMPGHSFSLVESLPELVCKTKKRPNRWVMCISEEKSYEYAKNILTEIAELFPYEYIHVGTDEIDMRDVKTKQGIQMQDWEKCEVCRRNFKKLGYKSITDKFYYFLRRIYAIVNSLGKKMMMWNDNIDISVSPELPRDILIEFWRVAAPMRGPRENCSMQRFIDEGFQVINADYPNTYIDLPEYVNWETLKSWDLTKVPADAGEKSYQILGAETCAWDVQKHFAHSLYTAVPAFADRCYNLAPVTDDEGFKVALTRLALGVSTPEGANVFGKFVKDIVMTDNDCKILAEGCDKAEFKSFLKSLKKQTPDEKLLTKAYLKRIK